MLRRRLIPAVITFTVMATLAVPTETQPASATPVDQCTKPLGQRVGGWTCGVTVVPAGKSTPQAAEAAAVGFCALDGCWNRISVVTSDFVGQGFYGYGKAQLGTSHMRFTVTTAGFRTTSKPLSAYTTRRTRNSVLSAERLYLSSAFPGGKGINGGASRRTSPCGPRVGSQNCTWAGVGGTGYSSTENTAQHISIVHELSWTDHEFPGRWHMFAKSLTMDRTRLGYRVIRSVTPSVRARGQWTPS